MPVVGSPRRRVRLTACLVAGALMSVSVPSPASAGQDMRSVGKGVVKNKAIAKIHRDSATRFDMDFGVAQFKTTRAKLSNEARASATRCTDCRAVGLSFQIVVLAGPSLQLQAENRSEAINTDCVRCEALSAAYQFVLATNQDVRLDRQDQQELDEVESQLQDLRRSEASLPELQAQIDALAGQVVDVLVDAVERNQPPAAQTPGTRAMASLGLRLDRLPPVLVNRDIRTRLAR